MTRDKSALKKAIGILMGRGLQVDVDTRGAFETWKVSGTRGVLYPSASTPELVAYAAGIKLGARIKEKGSRG